MGETQDPIAGKLQRRVAGPVALERRPCAVKLEAVELDHDLLAWPQRIDLEAGDGRIRDRAREAKGAAEVEEGTLEV